MILDTEKVTQYIVDWLKSYAVENNRKGFVINLNYKNSALTALLCKKTMINTLCMHFNSLSNDNNISNVSTFAEENNLRLMNKTMPDGYVPPKTMAAATLSTIAHDNKYLLIGSLDKTRSELVYDYQKYNDRADLEPLINLYASEIDQLLDSKLLYHRNTDELGLTLEELEWVSREEQVTKQMYDHGIITRVEDPAKHLFFNKYSTRQKQVVSKVYQLNKTNKHRETNAVKCDVRKNENWFR